MSLLRGKGRAVAFVVFICFLCCVGCGRRETVRMLDAAEAMMSEHPDSALRVLRSVDASSLPSAALRARHSLLMTMALDKNYIDTTDLRVIIPASTYFYRHGSFSEKMKTRYYHGVIYENRGEYDRALQLYSLALEDSARVEDNRCKELITSAIAGLYSKNYNAGQELRYATEALRYGSLSGDSLGVWRITGLLATCYGNLREWEKSDSTYAVFFSLPVYDSLSYYYRKIAYAKDLLKRPNPKPRQGADILQQIAAVRPDIMTVEAYALLAYAFQKLGNETVADEILGQLLSLGAQLDVVKYWRYKIYKDRGRSDRAIEDLEQSVLAQDSIIVATLAQSLIQARHDYLQSEMKVLKSENRMERHRVFIIILLSFLLCVFLVILLYRRKAVFAKKMEDLAVLYQESRQMLELKSTEGEIVHARLAQKDAALLSLRKQFASMYKAQYKMLNDLCAAYLSPVRKSRKDVLYEEAMRQMYFIINDEDSQQRFMSQVNESLDGIIDKLKNDLPNRKEQDFRFLAYVIVGFDATTIASLFGYSVGTVYTKKNRIKREITALSSPYRDLYLEFI